MAAEKIRLEVIGRDAGGDCCVCGSEGRRASCSLDYRSYWQLPSVKGSYRCSWGGLDGRLCRFDPFSSLIGKKEQYKAPVVPGDLSEGFVASTEATQDEESSILPVLEATRQSSLSVCAKGEGESF